MFSFECVVFVCVCVCVLFLLLQSDGANIHTEASNVPTWLGTRVMAFFVRRVNLVERVLGADDGGKTCRSVGREVSVEPESVSDVGPDVLGLALQPVQERHQLHQLIVRLVHEPRLNGDPILQLISKGLWGVVDDDRLLEVPAQDVKVFDVVPIDTDAVLSKKSELDPFPLWIQ